MDEDMTRLPASAAARLDLAQRVMDGAAEEILWLGSDGRICYCNDRACATLGYGREELLGLAVSEVEPVLTAERWLTHWERLKRDKALTFETLLRRRDGGLVPVEVVAGYLQSGAAEYYVGFLREAAGARETDAQLQELAGRDKLTEVPNRLLFCDRLHQAVAMAKRERQRKMALLLFDLKEFKTINQTFGRDIGDRLLREAAQRMRKCVRDSDTVARLGSDEFALLLASIDLRQSAALVAEKICNVLELPYHLDGRTISISLAVGIATYPEDGEEENAILDTAGKAMHSAKQSGHRMMFLG